LRGTVLEAIPITDKSLCTLYLGGLMHEAKNRAYPRLFSCLKELTIR